MKKLLLIFIFLNLTITSNAQTFKEQRTTFALTNIGINGLFGGIGALVNKKEGEKPFKVFLKGVGQGCLGGAVQVLGKELTYQINVKENLGYAWAARITNSIGSSITENAASNINFWERWHFNLGVVRFDYDVMTKKFQTRLLTTSLYGIGTMAWQAKLNLRKTLQTGILIFERDGQLSTFGTTATGLSVASSIGINRNVVDSQFYALMAHEVVHTLQYDGVAYINPLFYKQDRKWKAQSPFYKKASKYVYFDLNGPVFYTYYSLESLNPWRCRFIEREAEHFSERRLMPKCN